MKKEDNISKIMTQDVITVDVNDKLQHVNDIFAQSKIRHLPVTSEKALVGIISRTDIMRISFGNTFDDEEMGADDAIFDMLSINQIMKHSPVTVTVDQSIVEAAQLLADREFHALPVTNDGRLVGIVTTTDLIKYFISDN